MRYEPDLLIQSPDGFPIAVIEIKNREQLSPEVATWIRNDHLAHGLSDQVRFFLLISQEVGYLWDQRANPHANAAPSFKFSMRSVMAHRFPELQDDDRIGSAQLEFIVFQWLRDLIEREPDPLQGPENELMRLGFISAIRGGQIMFGAIV